MLSQSTVDYIKTWSNPNLSGSRFKSRSRLIVLEPETHGQDVEQHEGNFETPRFGIISRVRNLRNGNRLAMGNERDNRVRT